MAHRSLDVSQFETITSTTMNALAYLSRFSVKSKQAILLAYLTACLLTLNSAAANDLVLQYETLNPSVVTILATGQNKMDQSIGSGVIIDKEGRIITASHVVHTASSLIVKLANGSKYPADVISSVPSADVALIKLRNEPRDLKPAVLGDSDSAKIGSQISIIGAPFGLSHTLSIGYISGRLDQNRVAGGQVVDVIQTDASVNQGNSGGPMFNSQGEVVGIISSIATRGGGSDGIGFAIAINPAKSILLDSPSFWTGFDAIFLGPQFAAALNIPQGGGLLVQHVVSSSLASRAGLRGGNTPARLFERDVLLGGDVIVSIHGVSCSEGHDFSRIKQDLENLEEGEPFVIEILRDGKMIDITSTVNHSEFVR